MTTKTTEEIYDERIAPLMSEIVQICKDNNIPLVAQAMVRGADDEKMLVSTLHPESEDEPTFQFALSVMALTAFGNLDTFFMSLQQYIGKHGHTSLFWKAFELTMNKDMNQKVQNSAKS